MNEEENRMKVLLIPSSTLIPQEMRNRMGNIPTCLFPLQGRTMLERIYEKYRDHVDKIIVLLCKEKSKAIEYISLKKLPIDIVEIDELKDLGYTIFCGMNSLRSEFPNIETVYINFADTLLSNSVDTTASDKVYYAKEYYSSSWTFFHHKHGVFSEIIDKKEMKSSGREGFAFTGVFEIVHIEEFTELLNNQKSGNIDSFYHVLQEYSTLFPFECILSGKWVDVGHSDRYFQAKTGVAARAFNSIDIDQERGRLTKRSDNKDKFLGEIKWYVRLPDQLKYIAPRIYSYSLDWDNPYVTMEYYGYSTLHEKYVFGNLPDTIWRKIFQKIKFIMEDMGRYRVKESDGDQKEAMKEIYIDKTINRLKSLKKESLFFPFFENDIYINGIRYPSLNRIMEMIPDVITKRIIEPTKNEFCIIHGDLCFSNILYEHDYYFIRVIDPRGEFGKYDIYGDQRYELAKLMHSIDGKYDFITEDMFSVMVEDNAISLRITEKADRLYSIFKDVFSELLPQENDLRLIESLLFLSMLPLHSDTVNRQFAMLAIGIKLFTQSSGIFISR